MNINELEVFYHTATLEGLTQAAKHLGASKSHVSKSLTRLEEQLKTKLLIRNARQINLTEAGKCLLKYCNKIFLNIENAYAEIHQLQNEVSGTLAITTPPAIIENLLPSMIKDFTQSYPKVTLNIQMQSEVVNIIKSKIDLAIRATSQLEDSSLIARQLGKINYALFASHQYIKQYGLPEKLTEIKNHRCLLYLSNQKLYPWQTAGKNSKIIETNPAIYSNNIEFIKQQTLLSQGIALLPTYMCIHEEENGNLVRLFSSVKFVSHTLYAIFPYREHLAPKLRVFIDTLIEHLTHKRLD